MVMMWKILSGSARQVHSGKICICGIWYLASVPAQIRFAAQYQLPGSFAPTASFPLLRKAVEAAEKREGLHYMVGNLLSSDTFYSDSNLDVNWRKMGVLAVEMEAAALYMNAARTGKQALAICTISDSIVTGEATNSAEREKSFHDMMELALEIAPE